MGLEIEISKRPGVVGSRIEKVPHAQYIPENVHRSHRGRPRRRRASRIARGGRARRPRRRRTTTPHRTRPLREEGPRRRNRRDGDHFAPARDPGRRRHPGKRRQRLRRGARRFDHPDRGRAAHDHHHRLPLATVFRPGDGRDDLRQRQREHADGAASRLRRARPRHGARGGGARLVGRLRGGPRPPRFAAPKGADGGRDRLRPGRLRDAPVPLGRGLHPVREDRPHRRGPRDLLRRERDPPPGRDALPETVPRTPWSGSPRRGTTTSTGATSRRRSARWSRPRAAS